MYVYLSIMFFSSFMLILIAVCGLLIWNKKNIIKLWYIEGYNEVVVLFSSYLFENKDKLNEGGVGSKQRLFTIIIVSREIHNLYKNKYLQMLRIQYNSFLNVHHLH